MSAAAEPLSWLSVAIGVPLLLLLATAFLKSVVVLGALRVGLGARSLLPYGAVLALSFLVTALVMAPTVADIMAIIDARGGLDAVLAEPLSGIAAVFEPLRAFLSAHADAGEVAFFADLTGRPDGEVLVLVPAFTVTELSEAFVMAVLILVPFLLIDILALQVVALLGLADAAGPRLWLWTLPLKLLLFVSVAGLDAVIGGIVRGYA